MFFRTRYGTKFSIRVETLALNHIETHTPSPININCTIHEGDEECITYQHDTILIEVLYYLLDEWDNTFQSDPIQEAKEIGLGTHFVFEESAPILDRAFNHVRWSSARLRASANRSADAW